MLMSSQHRDRAQVLHSLIPYMIHWLQGRAPILVWEQHSEQRCSRSPCPDAANTMDMCIQLQGGCLERCSMPAARGPTFPAAALIVVVKTIFTNAPILETHFKKLCLIMGCFPSPSHMMSIFFCSKELIFVPFPKTSVESA